MVIVPVDAEEDEAEVIAQQLGDERAEGIEVVAGGDVQFEDHDGDEAGDDAVAEGFEAILAHAVQHTSPGGLLGIELSAFGLRQPRAEVPFEQAVRR